MAASGAGNGDGSIVDDGVCSGNGDSRRGGHYQLDGEVGRQLRDIAQRVVGLDDKGVESVVGGGGHIPATGVGRTAEDVGSEQVAFKEEVDAAHAGRIAGGDGKAAGLGNGRTDGVTLPEQVGKLRPEGIDLRGTTDRGDGLGFATRLVNGGHGKVVADSIFKPRD